MIFNKQFFKHRIQFFFFIIFESSLLFKSLIVTTVEFSAIQAPRNSFYLTLLYQTCNLAYAVLYRGSKEECTSQRRAKLESECEI